MNPFCVWSALTTELRDHFLEELGAALPSAYAGEVIGSLAGLVTHIQHIATLLERMERNDPEACAAFRRALERSGK